MSESKSQKTNPGTDIFDPADIRSSDDLTRNILEMLDTQDNPIKEMRTVNTVFQTGGKALLPKIIEVETGMNIPPLPQRELNL